MSMIRINHEPSKRQLAVFGGIWLVFFLAWCFVSWRREYSTNVTIALGVVGVLTPLIGLIQPRFMRLVYLGMSYLTLPIGWVVSHIILAIIYFLVMTPIGLAMRIFGYDPMRRRFDASASTYWVKRSPPGDSRRYFRQF